MKQGGREGAKWERLTGQRVCIVGCVPGPEVIVVTVGVTVLLEHAPEAVADSVKINLTVRVSVDVQKSQARWMRILDFTDFLVVSWYIEKILKIWQADLGEKELSFAVEFAILTLS